MSESLRLLIVEDQEIDVVLLERRLRSAGLAYTARNVASRQEFWRELDLFARTW